MRAEYWRDIIGYEGFYMVSNLGNVRGVKRQGSSGGIMKLDTRNDGYLQICLCKESKGKMHLVHRLVAAAFIGFAEDKKYVNHIDGNRSNNMLDNLEICDMKQNNQHRNYVLGKNVKPVICIETGEVFPSIRFAGRVKGIGNKEISLCCRNKPRYKTAGGYHWKYAEEADLA